MRVSLGFYTNAAASELVRLGVLADELGYDCLWTTDSHLIWREPYVTLGAIAARTSRIRLATSVTNPLTRHLTVTASALYTLAEVSGGRAVLGISVGDSSLKTMGLRTATVDRLEAAIGNLRQLLAGEAVAVPGGTTARLTYGGEQRVPIYVAATAPRLLRLAGQVADGVILMNGVAPELIGAALDLVAEGARSAGRDPATVESVVWAGCCASTSDPAAALAAVKYNVARAIQRAIPGPVDALTREVAERVRAHYDYYHHGDATAGFAELIPDELVPRYTFAGTPDQIAGQIQALAALGVGEVALAIPDAPNIPSRESVIRALAPLAG
ncbi:MAG: LLM class flavin-dependent oxidoreductase [Chloroflexi bacterium]|nr:LLM class flavin-dependent oxidoreductase [Chloroflexota bacterium]